MKWIILAVAVASVGCHATLRFSCTSDSQCRVGATQGVCIENGCALPSSGCASGYRYDVSAGSHAGLCVDSLGAGGSGEMTDMSTTDTTPPLSMDMSTPLLPDMAIQCGKVDQPCCPGANACVPGATCSMPSSTCALSDLWVGGTDITDLKNIKTVMMHFDGQSWTIGPVYSQSMVALWGNLPTDYYYAGLSGNVYRYDGGQWTLCVGGNTCPPTSSGADFQTVFGLASNDVWLAGSKEVLHFDGFNFVRTVLGLPSDFYMSQICGAKTNDVWGASLMGSYHWDGTQWHTFAAIKGAGCWAAAVNEVWIAGNEIRHWDGSQWSDTYTVDDGPLPGTIQTLHGTATDDVWGVGSDTNGNAVIIHWDGAKWSRIPGGGSKNLNRIFAVSKKNAWIPTGDATLLHWDGSTWSTYSNLPMRDNTFWGTVWGSATGGR